MPTSSAPNTKAVGPWRFASYKPESAWSFFPPIHLKNMNVKLDHFRRVLSWRFFPPIHHETYERQNGWTSSPIFFGVNIQKHIWVATTQWYTHRCPKKTSRIHSKMATLTIHLWNLTLGKYSSKHQLSGGMLNFGRVLIDGQHLQDVNPNHFQLGWLKQLQMIWEIYTSGNQDGYQNGWSGKYISCHLFSNMAIFVFSSMINLLGIFFQESEVRGN